MPQDKRIFLLLKNDSGSTILEFAAVVPIFFIVFLSLFEFGMYMYSRIIVENIAQEVSRVASIGILGTTECPADSKLTDSQNRVKLIECTVNKRSGFLINGTTSTIVQMQPLVTSGSGTKIPDICLDVSPPSSTPSTCVQFIDVNSNGKYEGMQANAAGCGGVNVEIRVIYLWSTLFHLFDRFFSVNGNNGISIVSAVTVVKNEPFGSLCL